MQKGVDGVTFLEVDEDKARTPYVTGYPTIVAHVKGSRYTYRGGPDYESLKYWVSRLVHIK